MLFLAVTAGFFVENMRENYIEHHRAKQFSKQLLADLRLDSLMFENWNRNIQNYFLLCSQQQNFSQQPHSLDIFGRTFS
jgi:hypothetical protein